MSIVLALAAWSVVCLLVAGMCWGAARGDALEEARSSAERASGSNPALGYMPPRRSM